MDYKQLLKLARKGDANDQLNLANAFYFGTDDTPFDYQFAMKWYRRAAKQGNAEAQFCVGYCYKYGKGVRQDYFKAAKWFKLSANQGNPKAQYHLAYAHEHVQGEVWDKQKAFELYQASANQGNKHAMFKMGKIYDEAQLDQPEDATKAFTWFKRASDKGHLEATNNVGDCYETGRGVEQNLSKAVSYYKKCAVDECPIGQYSLALCYAGGIGITKNTAKALELLTKSANNNCKEAQYELGMAYYGTDQAKDGYYWLQKASDNGHPKAPMYLGCCYVWGLGVKQDLALGRSYLQPFAQQGNAAAQYAMGMSYAMQTPADEKLAVSYLEKSANQGYIDACERLAKMYSNDTYKVVDFNKAIHWGEKAIKQDSTNVYFDVAYSYDKLAGDDNFKKALSLYSKVEGNLKASALHNMALIYLLKASKHTNYAKALDCATQAFNLGLETAKAILCRIYLYGYGVTKNYAKAYQFANDCKDTKGLREYWLGQIYYNGYGKAVDYSKAYNYFVASYNKGYKLAANNVGCCYYHGRGVATDDYKAFKYFQQAADNGDDVGYYNLADCYYNGYGVAKDTSRAISLARKSLQLGYQEAGNLLKKWGAM
ncbi:MAG: sel1 repeat family protein [Clostridia bacterium]|nr:sel1 repeat family protein [Clostridia bacterium]